MSEAEKGESELAMRVVAQMMSKDAFSQWLGIEVLDTRPRASTVRMRIRPEMVNGFGVAHGGVVYSLADSALAFAANTHGRVTVAVENSISYPAPINVGDVLTADAIEESGTNRLAFYRVTVKNERSAIVALFKGTVYKTNQDHFPDMARS